MSEKNRSTMAKEIFERVQINFKKQREAAADPSPMPSVQKVESGHERYEPSENFHKVLSTLMGNSQKAYKSIETNKSPKRLEMPEKIEKKIQEEKPAEPACQCPVAKSECTEIVVPPEIPKEEKKIPQPPQPSVFERLYHAGLAEDSGSEKKQDAAKQDSNVKGEKQETGSSNTSVSIFEKLSRNHTSS